MDKDRNPTPVKVSRNYIPSNSKVYHVSDGEPWISIAEKFKLSDGTVTNYNFQTKIPEEVNWYLMVNVLLIKL